MIFAFRSLESIMTVLTQPVVDAFDHVSTYIGAAAGLGTAAAGLVDASKAVGGGMSNPGFGYIRKAIEPLVAGESGALSSTDVLATLRANWLNGVAKDEQKAAAKSLVRLRLVPENAEALAAATGVDAQKLREATELLHSGAPLDAEHMNVLGQFDTAVNAILDYAYERGDQFYRNWAKIASAAVAVVLAVWGGALLREQTGYVGSADFFFAVLIGLISTPLAPLAKDLTSSLSEAVKAVSALRR
jgi:hypothetical protein